MTVTVACRQLLYFAQQQCPWASIFLLCTYNRYCGNKDSSFSLPSLWLDRTTTHLSLGGIEKRAVAASKESGKGLGHTNDLRGAIPETLS